MAESLKGKEAVITGVGSGFAKATAELFAEADQVGLVVIDHNEKALEVTAETCRTAGSKAGPFMLPCNSQGACTPHSLRATTAL